MAIFTNQASLLYNGNTISSNIAVGEILEVLTATKTAVEGSYTPGQLVTYVVTLRNTGSDALTGLTITDDLGGYPFGMGMVYPLTYEADSVLLIVDGAPQADPAVMAGPPLRFTGITVPADGSVVIVYQARANSFAPPGAAGTIINTVSVTGGGLMVPVVAEETVSGDAQAQLSITKSISPSQVQDNDRVTYTFVIQNTGSEPIVATDNAVISDLFNPILTDLTVIFEGMVWNQGVQYTYSEFTGQFNTLPGWLVIPAATYTQDPVTGAYTVTPGTATLTVTGTI